MDSILGPAFCRTHPVLGIVFKFLANIKKSMVFLAVDDVNVVDDDDDDDSMPTSVPGPVSATPASDIDIENDGASTVSSTSLARSMLR